MIYIVEIPHQMPPSAWSATSQAAAIEAISQIAPGMVYEKTNGAELIDAWGSLEEIRDSQPDLAELIEEHGEQTALYYDLEADEYTTDAISEWEACLRWNGHDLACQMVFESDEEAREALADPDVWARHGGTEARRALERELSL